MAKTPPIGVRLDPEAKAEIARIARDDARSVSSLISKIVNEWLAAKRLGYKTPADEAARQEHLRIQMSPDNPWLQDGSPLPWRYRNGKVVRVLDDGSEIDDR